jgi:CBS-domain-containing membrane protein
MKKVIKGGLSFFITMTCFGSIYSLHKLLFDDLGNHCLIAALGAAAVLTFSRNEASDYKPKNMFLGSVLGASLGVFFNTMPIDKTLAIMLAISSCVLLMEITQLKYPPGGAMALIPILSNKVIQDLGYLFILYPVLSGISIIFFFSKVQKIINKKL